MVAEIVDLAGKVAKEAKVARITPHHINMVIHGDEELQQLFGDIALPGGGADEVYTKEQLQALKKLGQKGKFGQIPAGK